MVFTAPIVAAAASQVAASRSEPETTDTTSLSDPVMADDIFMLGAVGLFLIALATIFVVLIL
jgi:hypothetical protein